MGFDDVISRSVLRDVWGETCLCICGGVALGYVTKSNTGSPNILFMPEKTLLALFFSLVFISVKTLLDGKMKKKNSGNFHVTCSKVYF